MAQTITSAVQTPEFTDYVIKNDSLKAGPAFDLLIDYHPSRSNYRVLEQEVVRVKASDKGLHSYDHPMRKLLETTDKGITEIAYTGISRRKQIANLLIHTARFDNRNQDELVILKHMRIRVFHHQQDSGILAQRQEIQLQANAPNPTSLLSSGEWFKISFEHDGLYQIDENFLQELGLDPGSIDPRNIQLWGTDGYELPISNNTPRPEIQQIPVIVEGEQNGSFDSGDRIIFYGNATTSIEYTPDDDLTHTHKLHPYSKYNSVFLTVADEPGLRFQETTLSQSPSATYTEFTDFLWKEEERHKPESGFKSGQQWLGQQFESNVNRTQTIFTDTIPGFQTSEEVHYELSMVSRSQSTSSFNLVLNGQQLQPISIQRVTYSSSTGAAANRGMRSQSLQLQAPDDIIQFDATYNPGDAQSRGWLEFIRMNVQRELRAKSNQLKFYPPGGSGTARFVLQGFSSRPFVFDVSNPVEPVLIGTQQSGQNYEIVYHNNPELKLFASSTFRSPVSGEQIQNQHISDITGYPDYIVITSEELLDYARELAEYRRQNDGLEPVVVTQQQIFNEFNGGVADITAIRDFVRYIYNRAPDTDRLPSYLLFFGNTSFDYKGVLRGSPMVNHVMTYQTPESLHRINSYASDDFFGILEESAGNILPGNSMDIGIGRLTVNTPGEAELIIDKIKRYEREDHLGDWRSIFTFLADDDINASSDSDRDLHILNADVVAERIPKDETGIRLEKIYQIEYPTVSTASGNRVPQATQAVVDRINNGTLVVNFSGHGNEDFLTSQRLFDIPDIDRLTNSDRLTIFITATCDYGRYDDNERFSGAERLMFTTDGGIVASFTTTRVVYTDSNPEGINNFALNIQLTEQMVQRDANGLPQRMGDIMRNTKNTVAGRSQNSKKFVLLGDPAMRIGLPENKIEISSINNIEIDHADSTLRQLRALDRVTIEGRVLQHNGQTNQMFNGEANVRMYDAGRHVSYPPKNWVPDRCRMATCGYDVQNDILFNGRVTVSNGTFRSEFIIPKDIAYSDSTGRIQVYSRGNNADAVGSWSRFFVNGRNPDAVDDGTGPEIDLYLNDDTFMNGSMTNDAPILRAVLEDNSGINTAGAGIGHEIVAVLTHQGSTQNQETIVLNEFYESEQDDFTRGRIEYPLSNLADGEYELTLRAWDVFNNVGETTIYFTVANSDELIIKNLYNYPNPMHNFTRFVFEHNQPGIPLDINIRIYTLSGRPVAEIRNESLITGGNIVLIDWEGRDSDHDRLANGTYLYHAKITADTPEGRQTFEKTERLVIIR